MDQSNNDSLISHSGRKTKRPIPLTPFETLVRAIEGFFDLYPPIDRTVLLSDLPKRWSSCPPLLLLPQTAFSSQEWKQYLEILPPSVLALFYSKVASSLKASHLALNAPIQSTSIRSPHITPLHGDFGPPVSEPPTQTDLGNIFWVATTQNGIKQT